MFSGKFLRSSFASDIRILPFLFLLTSCLAPQTNTKTIQRFAAALEDPSVAGALMPTPTPSPTPSPSATPIASVTPTATPPASFADGFGFNSPWMYGATHGPAATFPEMTEAARLMNNVTMRWPGGTVSRHYHINLPGYDGKQQGETENYIVPFARTFAPTGSGPLVKIAFVPNFDEHFDHILYQGSDEDLINDNLNTLKYLLDRGYNVTRVELGNELFLTPQLFWAFGNNPWRPLATINENVQALVEIKATYALNIQYQVDHFREGLDKYASLVATYQTRINQVMDAYGKPRPAYGVPIPWINGHNYVTDPITQQRTYVATYYSEAPIYYDLWNKKMKALPNMAYIPHFYETYVAGQSATVMTNLRKKFDELDEFFGTNARYWVTEFQVYETLNNIRNDDTPEQVALLNQIVDFFKARRVDQYYMHQFFKDGSDDGMLYKITSATSKPINGTLVNSVLAPNPIFGKVLFYSPKFCWAAKIRGPS